MPFFLDSLRAVGSISRSSSSAGRRGKGGKGKEGDCRWRKGEKPTNQSTHAAARSTIGLAAVSLPCCQAVKGRVSEVSNPSSSLSFPLSQHRTATHQHTLDATIRPSDGFLEETIPWSLHLLHHPRDRSHRRCAIRRTVERHDKSSSRSPSDPVLECGNIEWSTSDQYLGSAINGSGPNRSK